MLLNGRQNTVLSMMVEILILVLTEEDVITKETLLTQALGSATMPRVATTPFLSGVHFICNLESEVGSRK